MTGGRPAVFLDRDGTMSEERGFIDRLELLEIFPWTTDAVRLLNRARCVGRREAAFASNHLHSPLTQPIKPAGVQSNPNITILVLHEAEHTDAFPAFGSAEGRHSALAPSVGGIACP
jgi:hypothetical protein